MVERPDQPTTTLAIEDLGFLILDHPQISITRQVLSACVDAGCAVVVCDAKHLPSAVLLPFAGHSLHAQVVSAQADSSRPSRKRLWQRVVQAKIRAQAQVLETCRGDAGPLLGFIAVVRSGDPENVEAQAARAYWQRLLGQSFRREADAESGDQQRDRLNSLLNYGYAIVRAAVARAIVGSGLHPALGIHHCNQYNGYALADDLMEPLRPAVDRLVFEVSQGGRNPPELTSATKGVMLGLLASDCQIDGRPLTFLAALTNYTASVARVLANEQEEPLIPVVLG